jgi:diacylglycerol kinase (ATP)
MDNAVTDFTNIALSHERCLKTDSFESMKSDLLACISIAATLVKNPVAHVWSDRMLIKRKFCNVCRKKMEDVTGLCCEGNELNLMLSV